MFLHRLRSIEQDLTRAPVQNFAGLERIGDPNDGKALWTRLTDPEAIAEKIAARAVERRKEQAKHEALVRRALSERTGASADTDDEAVLAEKEAAHEAAPKPKSATCVVV